MPLWYLLWSPWRARWHSIPKKESSLHPHEFSSRSPFFQTGVDMNSLRKWKSPSLHQHRVWYCYVIPSSLIKTNQLLTALFWWQLLLRPYEMHRYDSDVWRLNVSEGEKQNTSKATVVDGTSEFGSQCFGDKRDRTCLDDSEGREEGGVCIFCKSNKGK